VENLAPTGIRSPDRPTRSESPHRLSYTGPHPDEKTRQQRSTPYRVPWLSSGGLAPQPLVTHSAPHRAELMASVPGSSRPHYRPHSLSHNYQAVSATLVTTSLVANQLAQTAGPHASHCADGTQQVVPPPYTTSLSVTETLYALPHDVSATFSLTYFVCDRGKTVCIPAQSVV
jgi:hypothetical protein